MEIRLYFDEGPGSDDIRKMIQSLVTSTAERVGVDIGCIRIVGIATEETYGTAVNEMFPGSGYTDNSGYTGVGKTESRITPTGLEHRILFHVFVPGVILRGFSAFGENFADWPADLLIGLFIIAHELGHCKHSEISPRDIDEINDLRSRADDFDVMNDHQFGVLVGEVSACFFGDRYYTEALFRYACKEDLSPLVKTWTALQNAKKSNLIDDVAYYANGLSWVYTIQFAKIVTSTIGTVLFDVPIQPPAELSSFFPVHNLLSHAVSDFCKSGLTDLASFREHIDLARESILKHLKVDIRIENGHWAYFWD